MKKLRLIFLLCLFYYPAYGQIETLWLDSTAYAGSNLSYFFTNRPLKKTEDGKIAFRNRWTRQTGKLDFSIYDYSDETTSLRYRASKTGPKDEYPTAYVEDNIFYRFYEKFRLEDGNRHLIFIIPGFGKTLDKQLEDFMYRINQYYTDSLNESTALILFAWGDQSIPLFYHKGKRSAKRAANDFAIFQQMLESFRGDSAYFADKPDDLSYTLVCTSMGNQLLKQYLLKREKQGIEMVKAYNRIVMIGSDASTDSFEDGKGFDNILEFTDDVVVLVNRKDGPLMLSQYMNMKHRLGRVGPTNLEELPENIRVYDITGMINWNDLPAMGHDYLLRNREIQNALLQRESEYQLMHFQKY